jgi:hypothetical protein
MPRAAPLLVALVLTFLIQSESHIAGKGKLDWRHPALRRHAARGSSLGTTTAFPSPVGGSFKPDTSNYNSPKCELELQYNLTALGATTFNFAVSITNNKQVSVPAANTHSTNALRPSFTPSIFTFLCLKRLVA